MLKPSRLLIHKDLHCITTAATFSLKKYKLKLYQLLSDFNLIMSTAALQNHAKYNFMFYITAPWHSAWCHGLVHHLQIHLFLPGVYEKLHGQENVPCSQLTPSFDPKTFLVGICKVKQLYDKYAKNSWQHKEVFSEGKNYLLIKSTP